MTVVCLCCGVCCCYLGPYREFHVASSDAHAYEFELEFTPTGEQIDVTVPEEVYTKTTAHKRMYMSGLYYEQVNG